MLTLNPGFVLIAAAMALLAAPRSLRVPIMAGAAVIAIVLMLGREFGAAETMAQMGLPVVLLNLDPLNRIFGIAMLIASVLIALYSGSRRNRFEDGAFLLARGQRRLGLVRGRPRELCGGSRACGPGDGGRRVRVERGGGGRVGGAAPGLVWLGRLALRRWRGAAFVCGSGQFGLHEA